MKVTVIVGLYGGIVDEVFVFDQASHDAAMATKDALEKDYEIEFDEDGRTVENQDNEVHFMEDVEVNDAKRIDIKPFMDARKAEELAASEAEAKAARDRSVELDQQREIDKVYQPGGATD